MGNQKSKIGVVYSTFYDLDIIEDSIRSVKEFADYIVVVHQSLGFNGQPEDSFNKEILARLEVDDILYYDATGKNKVDGMIEKMNIGLQYCKTNNCDYLVIGVADQAYDGPGTLSDVEKMDREQIDTAYYRIKAYYYDKNHYFIDTYFFPQIYKINDRVFKITTSSVLCDPLIKMEERKYFISKHFMHHFTFVRQTYQNKLNRSVRAIGSAKVSDDMMRIYNHLMKWKEGDDAIVFSNDLNNKGKVFVKTLKYNELNKITPPQPPIPEPVEGAVPEPVEGAVPEPVEGPNPKPQTPNLKRNSSITPRHSPIITRQSSLVTRQLDLVYILGSGSKWNNNELRYSLRSVQKNLQNFRNIYIVGTNPGFLNCQLPTATANSRIIFIPYPDQLGPRNADGNITRKIIRACQEKGLSDTFIKMNDDYIILSPIDAAHIYPMHKGEIPVKTKPLNSNPWRKRLYRTAEVLIEKRLPFLHYDYHAPFPINKHDFPQVVSQFNYEYHIGYTTRSMYGNIVYPDAIQLSWEKVKIFTPKTIAQINQLTKTPPLPEPVEGHSPLAKGGQGDLTANCHCQPPLFLAYNDDGLNNSLKFWLATQFPEPSVFETGDVDDPMATLAKWHNSGQNYQLGVEAFKHMYKNRNLLKIFTLAQNEALERKINFKLQLKLNDL